MSAIPWIFITVGILFVLLIIAIIVMMRRKSFKPDYYSLFMMGLIWTAIGIPLKNFFMSALGIIFLVVGLMHKKEWKQNRQAWSKLSKKDKKIRIIILVVLGLLVLAGLVVLVLKNKGIF